MLDRTSSRIVTLALVAMSTCTARETDCLDDDASCATREEALSPTTRQPPPASPAAPLPPWLHVEYDGCAVVLARSLGAVECVYEPGQELRLWIEHNLDEQPEITVDGVPWATQSHVRDDELGRGHRLVLDDSVHRTLQVRSKAGPRWHLVLRAIDRLTPREQAARARFDALSYDVEWRLARERDHAAIEDAERAISVGLRDGLLSDVARFGRAASYHIDHGLERSERAEELLEMLDHRLVGYPRGRAVASIYRAHTLRARGRLTEAARLYRRGGRFVVRMDDVGHQLDALAPYAWVLCELGYFEAAAYWAKVALGLTARAPRPQDHAMALDVVARVGLSLRRAGHLHDDPRPHFEAVMEAYGPEGPLEGLRAPAHAPLGLAELAVLEGDPAEAHRWLEGLDPARLTVDDQAEVQELRVRAMLAESPAPSASRLREALAELVALSERALDPGARWRVETVRGLVHEHVGERAAARAAYERSEDALDEMLAAMAIGVPGDFDTVRHGEASQRLVSMLVEDGDLARAVCVARQSRARLARLMLVRSDLDQLERDELDARLVRYAEGRAAYERLVRGEPGRSQPQREAAWAEADRLRTELDAQTSSILSSNRERGVRPTCEALSPALPGELLLVLVPDDDALRVFVVDERGITHTRLSGYGAVADTLDPHWFSEYLLSPIRDRLETATRVRVLASGRAAAIAVHALPWPVDGPEHQAVVAQSVAVVYGLELPAARAPGLASPPRALLLADRWADGAPAEIGDVKWSLERGGWSVQELDPSSQSRDEMLRALQSTDLLHYAGHAYFADIATDMPRRVDEDDRLRRWPPYSAGAAAVPSFIPLGERGRLTAPDILMMRRVPTTVVLMGCATGITDQRQAQGGLSLASAFLAAGSRAVVASTGEIDGHEAAMLGRALHATADDRVPLEPGRWMSRALVRALDDGLSTHAIEHYRVFVP